MNKCMKIIMNSTRNYKLDYFNFKNDYTELKQNEVLIKMMYAPINPSDYYSIKGIYWDKKPYPSVAGLEGMGRIIKSNNSNDNLIGKLVLVHFFNDPSEGAYSNYCKTNIKNILVIDDDDPFSLQFLINPLTAIGLKSLLEYNKINSYLQLGGSTTVGKLLLKLTNSDEYKSISILRNKNQFDFIKSFSNTNLISTDNNKFLDELKLQINKYLPLLSFDCYSGDKTGLVFNLMPNNSKTYIYGALEHKHISNIDPQCLIFQNKQIKGFHCFHDFIKNDSVNKYSNELKDLINVKIDLNKPKIFKLENFESAIDYYRNKNEKIILDLN